jgi:AcrR family transcriptional regulator
LAQRAERGKPRSVTHSSKSAEPEQPRWLSKDDVEIAPRPALTRRRIVDAALHLVEEDGLDALTMRRVAAALEVTPMSLYNHVVDKAELIDLMMDFIIGDVVEAARRDRGDWEARLRTHVRRNYDMWREHPGFVKVYTEGVTMGPNGLANTELALATLREAGFSDAEAGAAFMMLFRWSVSSLLIAPAEPVSRSSRGRRMGSLTSEERMKLFFSALPPEKVPSVKATVMHLSGHDLGFGLDVIIDGFKARLAEKAAGFADPTERAN